jgi:RimJ/RimL family protein N-acetyltransferase
MTLVSDKNTEITAWVGREVGIDDFGPCVAIGVVDGVRLVAGAVLHNYRPPGIEVTFASITPRWCTRNVMAGIFGYVFDQAGCRRLTAVTEAQKQSVRRFLCHLGFVEEGLIREGFATDDAVVYGMLRRECRWLRQVNYG